MHEVMAQRVHVGFDDIRIQFQIAIAVEQLPSPQARLQFP
jgi:hypothetical protein